MAVWWSNVEDALLKGGINLWPAGSKTHQLRDFLTFCIPHDPRGRSGRSKKGHTGTKGVPMATQYSRVASGNTT